MKTKLTAQKALKLFHLWEDLIISGELPDPKRFNQDFLKFYGGIIFYFVVAWNPAAYRILNVNK